MHVPSLFTAHRRNAPLSQQEAITEAFGHAGDCAAELDKSIHNTQQARKEGIDLGIGRVVTPWHKAGGCSKGHTLVRT